MLHFREGVRVGQVEGCEFCEVQPRIVGTMCIPCDRLIRAGSRLRELSPDSQVFKNGRWRLVLHDNGSELNDI